MLYLFNQFYFFQSGQRRSSFSVHPFINATLTVIAIFFCSRQGININKYFFSGFIKMDHTYSLPPSKLEQMYSLTSVKMDHTYSLLHSKAFPHQETVCRCGPNVKCKTIKCNCRAGNMFCTPSCDCNTPICSNQVCFL